METFPTVRIGGYRISRLIIGGNPFSGFSHISEEVSRRMREYYTDERILDALFEAERCGINTMIMRSDDHIMRIVSKFRDAGGTMYWIAQTAPEIKDWRSNILNMMQNKPIGIYFHGGRTDEIWDKGNIDEIEDVIKFIHDQGVMAGVATHRPEVVKDIEDRGWEVDFYMTCFYNPRRPPGEIYLPEDRDRMCEAIRNSSKPCIGFKVLAAGRNCRTKKDLYEAFKYALENIKSGDAIVVGVWQEKGNQISEDAEIVKKICWGDGSGYGPS